MPHGLENINGKTSFVSAHESAWHHLGQVLDHSFTAEEAMAEANLGGWDVRKAPAFGTDPKTGLQIPMPGRYGIMRDNLASGKAEYMGGDVGSVYTVIQNEDHAAFLNTLVDESGAHFETAGSINGGRQVFISMKLPGTMQIGGVDPVDMNIVAINSHDGSTPFTILTTPVRVVCANTLNVALHGFKSKATFRHTSGAERLIRTQAREALDLSFTYLDAFKTEMDQLIDTVLTQQRFEALIEKEFGASSDANQATQTRAGKKLDEMAQLFADAQTQEGIRGTAWAGFNALTEWYDHFSPTRGEDRELARAVNAVMFPEFKDKALRLMQAV